MTVALLLRFLDLVAALTWIGGMLFVALVLVPVTRRIDDPAALRRHLGAVHDFVLGPRAGRPDAPPSMRPAASWLARINVSLVLTVIYLGLSFR
jgi:putative copper export protein